ncbi:hypothetical protein NDN08_007872 [Rhodosorus marinus]|uniref:RING-type domain-containing protein n=1 Tax=Rhodosorus marinus TaxID=101924 RepID=A0AAV8V3F7_9RHOD|nr:hypothetical protein NDN08_007872 [Rhodosorus marinus]
MLKKETSDCGLPAPGGEVCSVCLGSPKEVDRGTLPACGHSFCLSCIVSWSRLQESCPLCKENFDTVLVRKDSRGKPLLFDDGVELGWSEQSLYSLVQAPWLKLEKFGSAEARKSEAEIEFRVEDFDELHLVRNRSELYEDMLEQAIALDVDDDEDLGRYRGSGRHRRAQGAKSNN